MKVNSSNVKKIKKDASEKGDLCAGVEETQGLNKELVLLEAGKAFVDGIFNRMKDILDTPKLSEEIKQLKEEISALKNELANKEKSNNNNVISGDDFDENDEDLENAFEPLMTRERNSLGRVSPDTYQKEYSSNMALSNEDAIARDVSTKLELFKNKDMYGLFKARLNNKFFNSELSDSLRELRDLSEQVIIPAKLEEFNKKYSEVAKTIREDLLMEAYRVNKNDLKKNKNSEKVQTYLKGVQNLLNPDQKQSPDEYIDWRLEKMRYDFGTFCLRADQDKLLQADKKACSFIEDFILNFQLISKDERKALRKLFEEELKSYTPLEWRGSLIAKTLLQASGVLDCNMKEITSPDKNFNAYLKKVADLVTDGDLSAAKEIVSIGTRVQKLPREYYNFLNLLFNGLDVSSSLNLSPDTTKIIEEAKLKYKEDLLKKQEKNLNMDENFVKDVAKGKHSDFVKEAIKIVKEKYPEKENLKEVEELLKEISKKGASQTISDNNIDGRSKDARFIKDMDATIKQIKEDSLSL